METHDYTPSGSAMSERQSYTALMDGLKVAAEGARHLCVLTNDLRWRNINVGLEATRQSIHAQAQMGDAPFSAMVELPRESQYTITQAFMLHISGLRQAAGGLRQMGGYHRQQLFWLDYANKIDDMREKASILLRRSTPIILSGELH